MQYFYPEYLENRFSVPTPEKRGVGAASSRINKINHHSTNQQISTTNNLSTQHETVKTDSKEVNIFSLHCTSVNLYGQIIKQTNIHLRYFKGRNFRGKKLSRFSRILGKFAKVNSAKYSKILIRESLFSRKKYFS